MVKIEIYSKDYCPYCHRAKALLESKGVKYIEIDINNDLQKLNEMHQRSRRHTVPQIFINEHHIGGCDDLFELEAENKLDTLLN